MAKSEDWRWSMVAGVACLSLCRLAHARSRLDSRTRRDYCLALGDGMPRKIRQLKSDLRRAGFIEQRDRGKGSHTRWVHPAVPGSAVTVSGHDGADAKAFQERDVRNVIARVEQSKT